MRLWLAMTSSQDRDGLSGQPTTSKPDDPPSTPNPKPNPTTPSQNEGLLPPAPASTPPPPIATAAPSQQPDEQGQQQNPQLAQPPQEALEKKELDQNARANLETPPPRPLQHHPANDTLVPDADADAPAAMEGNKKSAVPQDLPADQNLLTTPLPANTDTSAWTATVDSWLQAQAANYTADQPLLAGNINYPLQPADMSAWADMGLQGNFNQVGDIGSDQIGDEEEDEDDGYAPDVNTYGCLEFDDSTFWITTRSVLIGRDQAAYTQVKKQMERERKLGLNAGALLHSPDKLPVHHQAYTKSYISEEGGLLGPESDGEDNPRPAKRRRTNANGIVSSSKQQQQEGQARSRIISSRQYIDHTPGAVLVDVDHLRPSDEFVARVRIHGQASDGLIHTKGISRDHAKIQYNSRARVWEVVVLGRNGLFLNEKHMAADKVGTLRSGDRLQIQTVCFSFYLTGVEDGMTGAEEDSVSDAPISKTYSQGGKEMSFEFQSRDDGDKETSSSSISGDEPLVLDDASDQSDISDKEMEDASDLPTPTPDQDDDAIKGDATGTIRETVESEPMDEDIKKSPSTENALGLDQLQMPPKKRGPGRPPKNGIMSKREERILKKQAQEEAKKNMPPQEPGEQPQKRKVGRPRKHPRPEDDPDQPEKRKYKPRKPKGEGDDEDVEGEKPSKEKSQKAKTPPLELSRDDYTEEQLQKPTKNYQLLIDEIMVGAPPQGYSLKQIYKRIQKRWPYFYFNVDTKGWESSVRHNLLGSDCFKKIDGHWHRVPGVPLESGKKQRKPSPIASPRPASLYNGGYGHHPYQPPGHPQHPGHQTIAHGTGLSQPNLPPRYPPNGQAYQIAQGPPQRPGQPGIAPSQQPPVRPGFPQSQVPTTAPQPHGYANANAPPRPQYVPNQAPPYNPAFANRPLPPSGANPGAAGPGVAQMQAQNPAQRPPPARPSQAPSAVPQQGFQPAQTHAQQNVQRTASAPHLQPSLPNNAAPAPLGPVIDPILRDFVTNFKIEVIKQLQGKEGKKSDAVAMSVINRGLGLTDRSLTPECEAYEKLILDVFHKHKATFPTVLASKRRAQEAARATPTVPAANSTPIVAPSAVNANRLSASASPRVGSVATVSAMPTTKATVTNGQTSMSTTITGTAAKGDLKAIGSTVTKVGESAVAKPVVAPTIIPSPNAPVTTAPSTAASCSNAAGSIAPSAPIQTNTASNPQPATPQGPPPKPSNSPAPSVPTNTQSQTPTVASGTSASAAPTVAAATDSTATKAVTVSDVSTTPVKATPTAQQSSTSSPAAVAAATPNTALPKPAITNPSQNVPPKAAPSTQQSGPAVASASAPSHQITANNASAAPAKSITSQAAPPPKPASVSPSVKPPAAMTSAPTPKTVATTPVPSVVASTGPRSATPGQIAASTRPAASSSPAPIPNDQRAASTASASASANGTDVQLLDPKLVNLILSFKKTILPTLVGRLGSLLSESLVMSAVDRLLGFTNDTFVQAKNEQQKQHFEEAERALMMHLETRFKDYVRNRATSK